MKSHVKAVVIGGGVVGCSVLFHLARAGWTDVLLIERSELTSGSSWRGVMQSTSRTTPVSLSKSVSRINLSGRYRRRIARAAGSGMSRRLNVLQVCDHLGWEGSRMHGVKRLFAWMIPRFDRTRFNVSLISLRKRDLSNDTLDELGIDVTYMHRSKFDPATLPALLKELDRRQADVVHLHGYGASTFGRLAAAIRHIPVVVHEHANLTDTPWFQKVADRALAPATDIAIAVSQSTADFTTRARLIPAERTKVVYLGVPLEEFSRVRTAEEVAEARLALGVPARTFAIGTITRLMPSKGNEYLVEASRRVVDALPAARIYVIGVG